MIAQGFKVQMFRYHIFLPDTDSDPPTCMLADNPIPAHENIKYFLFFTAVYCMDVTLHLSMLYGLAQVQPFVKHEQIHKENVNAVELSFTMWKEDK